MYRDSMRHLQERGLFLPIRDSVTSQKKVLRICLGYHNHSSGLRPRARMKIALDCAAGVGVVICESHSLCEIDCARLAGEGRIQVYDMHASGNCLFSSGGL